MNLQSETAIRARQPKRPDSKAGTVRRILADGPALTCDVVAETGWHRKLASGHLINLWKRGELTREPFIRPGKSLAYLYSLKARP